jgi:hypothetical protein
MDTVVGDLLGLGLPRVRRLRPDERLPWNPDQRAKGGVRTDDPAGLGRGDDERQRERVEDGAQLAFRGREEDDGFGHVAIETSRRGLQSTISAGGAGFYPSTRASCLTRFGDRRAVGA